MTTLYPLVMAREAVIASEHYLSASAGARIFARGGNAIDAAIAAAFVEGVVNPHMHTSGGEAPMLIYAAKARRVIAINGNMTAPGRATIERYRTLGHSLVPHSGLLAAGVPGWVEVLRPGGAVGIAVGSAFSSWLADRLRRPSPAPSTATAPARRRWRGAPRRSASGATRARRGSTRRSASTRPG